MACTSMYLLISAVMVMACQGFRESFECLGECVLLSEIQEGDRTCDRAFGSCTYGYMCCAFPSIVTEAPPPPPPPPPSPPPSSGCPETCILSTQEIRKRFFHCSPDHGTCPTPNYECCKYLGPNAFN